eukprot:5086774-Amphidinium_carterae.1
MAHAMEGGDPGGLQAFCSDLALKSLQPCVEDPWIHPPPQIQAPAPRAVVSLADLLIAGLVDSCGCKCQASVINLRPGGVSRSMTTTNSMCSSSQWRWYCYVPLPS